MTLLNTPMPADKALKIIRSILESNNMVEIDWVFMLDRWMYGISEEPLVTSVWWFKQVNVKLGVYGAVNNEIVIRSITLVIPQYEIWQKVLIISTGELWEVQSIWAYGYTVLVLGTVNWQQVSAYNDYHWSDLAKLPNDL